MKKINLFFIAFLFSASSYATDTLVLNNQMTFVGKVKKVKECTLSFETFGETFDIPASEIYSVRFEDINNNIYTKYLKQADNPNNCLAGHIDAENFHGKKAAHFTLGFLFGPFAMIGTALTNPKPEKGRETLLLSNNKHLFNDPQYLLCYKRRAKTMMIGYDLIGWSAWLMIVGTIAGSM